VPMVPRAATRRKAVAPTVRAICHGGSCGANVVARVGNMVRQEEGARNIFRRRGGGDAAEARDLISYWFMRPSGLELLVNAALSCGCLLWLRA